MAWASVIGIVGLKAETCAFAIRVVDLADDAPARAGRIRMKSLHSASALGSGIALGSQARQAISGVPSQFSCR